MNKLPQITLAFWVMKICATTLGETAGDLLSMTLNVGYAISSMILISVFLVTLVTQLWSKTYNPVLYWIVILSTVVVVAVGLLYMLAARPWEKSTAAAGDAVGGGA